MSDSNLQKKQKIKDYLQTHPSSRVSQILPRMSVNVEHLGECRPPFYCSYTEHLLNALFSLHSLPFFPLVCTCTRYNNHQNTLIMCLKEIEQKLATYEPVSEAGDAEVEIRNSTKNKGYPLSLSKGELL